MGEKILIACPFCGVELFDEKFELPIPAEQVTLTYQIVGDLKISCRNCGEEVGDRVVAVINGYARLVQAVMPFSNQPYGLLHGFIKTVNGLLPTVVQTKGTGKLPKDRALELRYGLVDGKQRKLGEIIGETKLTVERVRQLIIAAQRILRHPSRSMIIHNKFWQSPESFATVLARAENAEEELRQMRKDFIPKFEFMKALLESHGLLDKVFPDVPHILIGELNLSLKAHFSLARAGLLSVDRILTRDPEELLSLRNFGQVSFNQLVEAILAKGIDLEKYWGKELAKRYKPRK